MRSYTYLTGTDIVEGATKILYILGGKLDYKKTDKRVSVELFFLLVVQRINQKEDINEDFLLDINQLQENAIMVRENVVDKQRLISNIIKSKSCPKDPELREDLGIILQDISSLINHTSFTFERLEYLQDTAVGLINLDQNRIMKIFTFISLLLMPATLVASFYGMNVELPFAQNWWAWIAILGAMGMIVAVLWFLFKRKRML